MVVRTQQLVCATVPTTIAVSFPGDQTPSSLFVRVLLLLRMPCAVFFVPVSLPIIHRAQESTNKSECFLKVAVTVLCEHPLDR